MKYATRILVCIIAISKLQEFLWKFVDFLIFFDHDAAVFTSTCHNFPTTTRGIRFLRQVDVFSTTSYTTGLHKTESSLHFCLTQSNVMVIKHHTWSLAVISCLITTRSARMRTFVMADRSWRAARTIVVFSPTLLTVLALSNLTFVRDSIREPHTRPPHSTRCSRTPTDLLATEIICYWHATTAETLYL